MPLGGRSIEIHGLKELNRELKRVDAGFPKAMRKAGLAAAAVVTATAQARAAAGTPTQRKAARAIKARAGAGRAAVAVVPSRAIPFAFGAFFGAKQYPQFDRWVGNTWDAGSRTSGPYAINPAIADTKDEVIDLYATAILEITDKAFPS